MFTNILLLFITTITFYVGYNYKAVIMFILTLFFEETCKRFKTFRLDCLKKNEENKTMSMEFLYKNKEYIFCLPIDKDTTNETKEKEPQIIALDGITNVTTVFLKFLGPNYDFFGSTLKPKHMGFKTLLVWLMHKRYAFENDHNIIFNQESNTRLLEHEKALENQSDFSSSDEVTESDNEVTESDNEVTESENK